MEPVFNVHKCIPLSAILTDVGITFDDLPFIRPHKRFGMCYQSILGYCSSCERKMCDKYAPTVQEIAAPGFAEELVSKLKPGVEDIFKNGLPKLQHKKRTFGQ